MATDPATRPRRFTRREPEKDAPSEFRERAFAWLTRPPGVRLPFPEEGGGRKRRAKRQPAAPRDRRAAFRKAAWSWMRARAAAAPGLVVAPEPAAAPELVVAPEPAAAPAEETGKGKRRARREPRLDPVVAFRKAAWTWMNRPDGPGASALSTSGPAAVSDVARAHLKGVIEALIFASEHPLPTREVARIAQAEARLVKVLLGELVEDYRGRGFRLDEIAGGFVFRTSPAFAPFVREQVAKKPVKMTRTQIETLAIVAYRQPVTRPEIDEVRGVDSGAVLKSLLERDLIRILGKRDEPGRPMLYGTTPQFLELFGLKALADLPTLREFTELTDESRRTYEREMGEDPDAATPQAEGLMGGEGSFRKGRAAGAPEEGVSQAAEGGTGTNEFEFVEPPGADGLPAGSEEAEAAEAAATGLVEPGEPGPRHREETGDEDDAGNAPEPAEASEVTADAEDAGVDEAADEDEDDAEADEVDDDDDDDEDEDDDEDDDDDEDAEDEAGD